jgi:hypothetical protein
MVTDYIVHRRRQPDFSVHGTGRKVLPVELEKHWAPQLTAFSRLPISVSTEQIVKDGFFVRNYICITIERAPKYVTLLSQV